MLPLIGQLELLNSDQEIEGLAQQIFGVVDEHVIPKRSAFRVARLQSDTQPSLFYVVIVCHAKTLVGVHREAQALEENGGCAQKKLPWWVPEGVPLLARIEWLIVQVAAVLFLPKIKGKFSL